MPLCPFPIHPSAWRRCAKPYKLSDSDGLYLEIKPSGSRYRRLKYRFDGKEKRLALGVYPVVTLARARADALGARLLLHDGIDPSVHKKDREREAKRAAANSFEAIARHWHSVMRARLSGRSDRDKSISENTLLYALYRTGYHQCATTHGFRALASTILNESGLWRPDAIERQLAHKEQNAVRAAYHRSEYLEERTRTMQWWADFLDASEREVAGGQPT